VTLNILITGGCGFIGSNLAEYHLAKGDTVYVMDNLSTGSLKNIAGFQNNPNFEFEEGDILNWPNINKITLWAHRIYHLAAIIGVRKVLEDPVQVLETNIGGCAILLKTIAQNKSSAQVIIASSSSVYGYREKDLLNEDDYLGIGPAHHQPAGYAISKMADEAYGVAYAQKFHIPVILFRFFNTIGARQTGRYGMVVPRFVEQACTNQPITIYGDGTQTRSFCDVRDVIVAINKLAEKAPGQGDVFNVGNAHELCINDLAKLVKDRAQSDSELVHLPFQKVYGENYFEIKQRRPDLSKLYQYTQFKAQIPLEKTIDDLIAIFRNRGSVIQNS
jgi:UDP-glucose 4-epimerase